MARISHLHTVTSFEQVRRIEFLLFILQSNQNWATINFEVKFHVLRQNLIELMRLPSVRHILMSHLKFLKSSVN